MSISISQFIFPLSPLISICLFSMSVSLFLLQFSSIQFSHSVVSDSLQPYGLQDTRLRVHHQLLELFKLMSIESVMPSNHRILCRSLLLPSIFPSIRIFSNEPVLYIRWPKYWSFSFSISPFNEYSEYLVRSVQFSSVAQLCPTLCDPMNCSTPGLLSITSSRSSLKLMSIESVMPSSHLILCHPLLLLTIEYYSAIQRSRTGSYAETCMDLEMVIQSEVSQKEKNKYCILMHICRI